MTDGTYGSTSDFVTALGNQTAAFALDLGDDKSRYLYITVMQKPICVCYVMASRSYAAVVIVFYLLK